jgi:hypothetical protein
VVDDLPEHQLADVGAALEQQIVRGELGRDHVLGDLLGGRQQV